MTSFQNTVLTDGGREQELLSIARPIDEPLVASAFGRCARAHVHLGPLHADDISDEALEAVIERAGVVSLDVQGLLRASTIGRVHRTLARALPRGLSAARFVKASADELELMGDVLSRIHVEELVVTSGNAGGYVVNQTGRTAFAAPSIERVDDSTGAGDVFFAEYLVGRIHQGASVTCSCARAAALAAKQVAGNFLRPADLALISAS
jgi:sugar/nucleoside kinase (ribokinase family)